MTPKKLLYTGEQIFGLKLHIESTGRDDVDKAMKQVFHDDYRNTAPLDMIREDVQLVLSWSRGELDEFEPEKQMSLFK